MSVETSREIEHRALAWLAKRDGGGWSEADQSEFTQWLEARIAHRVTFLRLEAGWERSARLKAFGVGKTPGVVPPPEEWRSSHFFERKRTAKIRSAIWASAPKLAAIAAGIALVVAVAVQLKIFSQETTYATPIGGISSVPLSDGSSVTLNTGSELRVSMNETERHIELHSGEAFFDVARDPSRPFVVQAGDRRIVVLGTRFSVRRDGADVTVVVTDGKVRVEPQTKNDSAQLLTAGDVLRAARNSSQVQKKSVHEAEEALSWRSGYLIFNDTSVADAVGEFNRYTPQRVLVDDPQLSALKISGKFRATNADDFVQLLQRGFGVQARRSEDSIYLSWN